MDPAADAVPFESLLAHRDWVRRLARALARDEAGADDLEQETWLRAMVRPPRDPRGLRGWLGTVARHLAVDRGRSEERSRRHEAAAARREGVVPSPADLVAEAEAHRRVVDAVLALEEPYRATVLLRWFEDLGPTELAARTGVPVETVRTRLRRANERIRERIGGGGAWRAALLPLLARSPEGAPPVPAAPPWKGIAIMGAKTKVAAAAALVLGACWWFAGARSGDDRGRGGDGAAPPAGGEIAEAAETRSGPSAEGEPGPVPGEGGLPSGAANPGARSGLQPADAPAAATPGDRDAVSGRVVDERRNAVAGVRLRIVSLAKPLGPGESLPEPRYEVVTGDDGGFLLRGLGEEDRSLGVRLEVPGFSQRETWVGPGTHGIELALVPLHELAGVVVEGSTGPGVAGIQVVVRRADEGPAGPAYAVRSTDSEGRFSFPPLPAGEYALDVGILYGAEPGADGGSEFIRRTVPRVTAGTRDLRIEIVRGLALAGTMVDDSGALVASAVRVQALGINDQGGPDYGRLRIREVRDPGGAFRVSGLPPGRYDLTFTPEAEGEENAGVRPAATLVQGVSAGTEGLRVVLRAGRPLRVLLLDERGETVKVAGYVYVYPTGSQAGRHDGVIAKKEEDGSFTTPPLDEGRTWDVYAIGFEGFVPITVKGLHPGDPPTPITLPRGGAIAGTVLDEDGKQVTAGVPVSAHAEGADLTRPGTGMVAYTDAGGAFRIIGLDEHSFTVTAGGGETVFASGEPRRGVRVGEKSLVLRVRRGAEIRGRLVDDAGRPFRTHFLAAHASGTIGSVSPWTRVESEDGSFVLRGVLAGKVRLSCYRGEEYVDLGEFTAPAEGLVVEVPSR